MSSNSKHELRFTETNSADDSAGKTLGLEATSSGIRRRVLLACLHEKLRL
jgi:hypothetical protein